MLNLRPSKLNNMQEKSAERSFVRLLKIMDELREKCPWDRKQTMNSLRYLSIEEIYELSDAIVEKNNDEIKKELGDLLLHIVFYARIASESDTFDISDVINTVCDKLVYRHPHIYGEVKVANDVEVKENWEKLKLKEGKESVLEGVPNSLPSMIKAFRIQEKVRGVGFDWNDTSQVFDKVKEELTRGTLGDLYNSDNCKLSLNTIKLIRLKFTLVCTLGYLHLLYFKLGSTSGVA